MSKGPRNRIVGLPLWRTALALVGKGSVGRRILTSTGVLFLGGLAFLFGRSIGLQTINATPPQPSTTAPGEMQMYSDAYKGRVVAYINDNEPIYREDLAEYLIARFGAERLEFFVNRIIIEHACKAKGIFVTDTQIELQLREDLKGIGNGVTEQLFEKEILSRYHKTIFEWKEDVIRPKLMLSHLCRPMIHLTEDDLKEGFEARYGAKVQCRMILCKDQNEASTKWQRIMTGAKIEPDKIDPARLEAAFLDEAGRQGDSRLASVKGQVPPIHTHFGDRRVEREAFRLKPGEMSQVLEMNDHTAIILFCERIIPAETFRKFLDERIAIEADMKEIRLAEKMNEYLRELRQAARPRLLLSRHQNPAQVEMDAEDAMRRTDLKFRPN
ncbi:MAG TPA: hypothetical protein VHR72_02170 [Gemmataceae bacterium]|nr:hypothetical protein [Gemmataceae bacterium]